MKATSHDVRRLFGDIDDHKVAEIVASGATIAELEQVLAYLSRQTDVMGEMAKPLTGRAARIYELLRRDEETFEEP